MVKLLSHAPGWTYEKALRPVCPKEAGTTSMSNSLTLGHAPIFCHVCVW